MAISKAGKAALKKLPAALKKVKVTKSGKGGKAKGGSSGSPSGGG